MRRPSALGRRVAVTAHCRRARWFDADRGRKSLVDEHRVAKSRLIFGAGLQPLAVKKRGRCRLWRCSQICAIAARAPQR
jgi:hypothetical protein